MLFNGETWKSEMEKSTGAKGLEPRKAVVGSDFCYWKEDGRKEKRDRQVQWLTLGDKSQL